MGAGVGSWSHQDGPVSPKGESKTRKEECSSECQIFSLDAEFLFGCHWSSPPGPEGLRNSQTCLDCAFFMAPHWGGEEGVVGVVGRGGRGEEKKKF